MPLIRGIRNWFSRRMADLSMTGMAAADGGMSLNSTSWLWLVVFALLIPIIAVLVLIGLIYELIIRIDGRRLGRNMEWALSSAAAVALLVALYVFFVLR